MSQDRKDGLLYLGIPAIALLLMTIFFTNEKSCERQVYGDETTTSWEFLIKVGDQLQEEKGFKEGMIVGAQPVGFLWGENDKKHFIRIRVDNISKTEVDLILKSRDKYIGTKDEEKYCIGYYVDLSALQTISGDSKLLEKVHAKQDIGLISNIAINKTTIFKDIETYDYKRPFIPSSISSGTFTVGTAKTYALLSTAVADLTNLAGNLTLDVQTSITDNAQADCSISLGGYTLLIHASASYRHTGTPTSGSLITVSYTGSSYFFNNAEGAGTIEIAYLRFHSATNYSPQYNFLRTAYIDTAHTLRIHHNYFEGGDYGAGSIGGVVNDDATMTSSYFLIYNNAFWNFSTNCILLENAGGIIENNSMYMFGTSGIDNTNETSTIKNNVIIKTDLGNCFLNIATGATGTNNACSDTTGQDADFATGTGNIASITAANNWASVTDTEDNYLYVKDATAGIYNSGADGTYATIDIVDYTRVSSSWDMGFHELQVASPTPTPTPTVLFKPKVIFMD